MNFCKWWILNSQFLKMYLIYQLISFYNRYVFLISKYNGKCSKHMVRFWSAFCVVKSRFQVFISTVFDLSDLRQSQKHRNEKVTGIWPSAIFTSSLGDQSRGLDVKARLVKQIVAIQKIIAFIRSFSSSIREVSISYFLIGLVYSDWTGMSYWVWAWAGSKRGSRPWCDCGGWAKKTCWF